MTRGRNVTAINHDRRMHRGVSSSPDVVVSRLDEPMPLRRRASSFLPCTSAVIHHRAGDSRAVSKPAPFLVAYTKSKESASIEFSGPEDKTRESLGRWFSNGVPFGLSFQRNLFYRAFINFS